MDKIIKIKGEEFGRVSYIFSEYIYDIPVQKRFDFGTLTMFEFEIYDEGSCRGFIVIDPGEIVPVYYRFDVNWARDEVEVEETDLLSIFREVEDNEELTPVTKDMVIESAIEKYRNIVDAGKQGIGLLLVTKENKHCALQYVFDGELDYSLIEDMVILADSDNFDTLFDLSKQLSRKLKIKLKLLDA